MQIETSFPNTSVLSLALEKMNENRTRINFIFKSTIMNTENRNDIFDGFIDSFLNEIDYNFKKVTIPYLRPYQIAEDTSLFSQGAFEPVQSNYSNQVNETIFLLERNNDYFGYILDRFTPLASNGNLPPLELYRIKIYLSPLMNLTLRS